MKIKKKYFLIYFTLFVFISIALSLTSYWLSNDILLSKYKNLSLENLNYLKEITDREIKQLVKPYSLVSSSRVVIDRIENRFSPQDALYEIEADDKVSDLFLTLSTFEIFEAVRVVYMFGDTGEEYWYRTPKHALNRVLIQNEISKLNIRPNELYYMGIGKSNSTYNRDEIVLKFAKYINNDNYKKIGAVYFELSTNYFAKLYKSEKVDDGTSILLLDSDSRVIFHENEELIGTICKKSNRHSLKVSKKIDIYDWELISISSEKIIFSENYRVIRTIFLMALISIIISTIVIGIITGRVVRPIVDLTKAMKKVEDGNLDITIDHIANDEIGELTKGFNNMISRLKGNLERERHNEKVRTDSEYKALQTQINPHFMYNSLNTLKWMANVQKAGNIAKLVDALWKLLRMTSSFKGQSIPLSSEIEVIDAYATIQQIRYKGKFTIEYKIDPEHLNIKIPKFILEPFVENAIFHGIEPKIGTGIITLQTCIEEPDLVIKVKDSGIGIEEDKIAKILVNSSEQQSGDGFNNIGIKNVDERLRLLFGINYGLNITSTLGEGTTIKVKIPLDYSNKERTK